MNKTYLLLRILAVIGRYGPHLMTVIFVTQNNFQNVPRISDRLLGFYLDSVTPTITPICSGPDIGRFVLSYPNSSVVVQQTEANQRSRQQHSQHTFQNA